MSVNIKKNVEKDIHYIGMPVVRTDGRVGGRSVYGHMITKFSRMGSLPHFFTHGAPLRVLRARELRYDCRLNWTLLSLTEIVNLCLICRTSNLEQIFSC